MSDDFSEEFLAEMRALLEEERDRLVERQQNTVDEIHEIRDGDAGILDTIDITTMEQTTSEMLHFRDRELARLKEVQFALDRLNDGTYGYCDDTDEPIPEGRLRANPAARLTVEAQADREAEEKRRNFRPGLMDDME